MLQRLLLLCGQLVRISETGDWRERNIRARRRERNWRQGIRVRERKATAETSEIADTRGGERVKGLEEAAQFAR